MDVFFKVEGGENIGKTGKNWGEENRAGKMKIAKEKASTGD
jgi:hypothetical protein